MANNPQIITAANSNPHSLPYITYGGGSGSGDGGNLEPRIAKLESDVESIKGSVSTIRGDLRSLLYIFLGAAALTIAAYAAGYFRVEDKIADSSSDLDKKIITLNEKISSSERTIIEKLNTIQHAINESDKHESQGSPSEGKAERVHKRAP